MGYAVSEMRRRVSAGIFLAVLLTGALWGQKAEPVRIALKDGEATVQGRLRGRQQMDYEAEAGASQTITVHLAATPAQTLALKLYSPEGGEMPLHTAGANRWAAELPKSGNYGISVLRTGRQRGATTYKLTVTIR